MKLLMKQIVLRNSGLWPLSWKGQVLRIGAKAGTTGKIFGSVTNVQIIKALKDQMGIEVIRKKVELPEEVKVLGEYTAVVNFHPEVQTTVKFEVVEE
jgi:large subunit ribosomal protein L9